MTARQTDIESLDKGTDASLAEPGFLSVLLGFGLYSLLALDNDDSARTSCIPLLARILIGTSLQIGECCDSRATVVKPPG